MPRTRKNHARYARVEELRAQGKKFQEIADELGISRQRAHEIYSRTLPKKTSNMSVISRHARHTQRAA